MIIKHVLTDCPFRFLHITATCRANAILHLPHTSPYVLTPLPLSTRTKKTCMTGLRLSQTHRLSM